MSDQDHSTAPRFEHVMLDLGADAGALVIYTEHTLHASEIELSTTACEARRSHKQVHARPLGNAVVYAAVFDRVAPGDYSVWLGDARREHGIAVTAACVTELDWRGTDHSVRGDDT